MRTLHRTVTGLLILPLAVGLAACGDDDDAATTTTTEASEPTSVEVTAVDYAFEGLPDSVPSGTKLTLVNDSELELHEMVVLRIPDGEERSVEDLLNLSEEEQGAVFGEAEPAMVILAAPGGDPIPAVGDGTLTEPGRYAVVCFIPQGADPEAYLNAPPSDGPPQVDGGDEHFKLGMHTELQVD